MFRNVAVLAALCLFTAAYVAASNAGSASNGTTRRYYIQAEEVLWQYGDDWVNNCTGLNYTDGAEMYMQQGSGAHYWKALYIAYTDDTFQTKVVRPAEEEHLAVLGPLIRAEVGDTLEIVFRNALSYDVNLVPTGLELQENDTLPVGSNATTTYSWPVTSRAGPGPSDLSSKLWMYGSNVDLVGDQSAGLIGPMIIVREGMATSDAKPIDVDIEFVTMFYLFQENLSPLFNKTLETYNLTDPLVQTNLTAANWIESNNMHAINGMMYCWLPGLVIPQDAGSARWHVTVEGAEQDIHNSHWHGMTLLHEGHYVDQFSLFAGQVFSGDMVLDNPGTWWFHCHINDHVHGGMLALYTLEGDLQYPQDQGDVQQYFIAAEEAAWDYAPQKMDMCSGSPQPFDDSSSVFVQPSNFSLQMGSLVQKALFFEYTDATFTTRKAADPALGYLGPTLRAKVGDTIKVTFKNKCSFSTSLHPHGVLYAKDSEGTPYNDGTSGADKMDDHVHTGQMWNFTWLVANRTAPGPSDGSSVVWMYHSHAHETQDTLAGLMGAIIITTADMATAENTPKDVDREIVLAFNINDETSSFMFRENLGLSFPSIPELQYNVLAQTASFMAAHNYHAINGYIFCNGPTFNATVGERVRFYIMTLGTEADLHNPNIITSQWMSLGHRSEALQSIAGDMQTADVILQSSGDWLLQCRASEHFAQGMKAILHVEPAGEQDPTFNGTERLSYIAATEILWDYIPQGLDGCDRRNFTADEASQWGDGTMGHSYLKAVYREFTDGSFTTMKNQTNPTDGLLGPTLHAEIGDMITIVFQNKLSQSVNLQMGGGLWALHNDSLVDAPIQPGEAVTYSWLVPSESGPGPSDLSTIAYAYTSSVDLVGDINAGLMGPVVIGNQGAFGKGGFPVGVDREIALAYVKQDEQSSSLFNDNLAFSNFTVPDYLTDYDDYSDWQGTVTYYTINGWIFCNQPDMQLQQGEVVRLILLGMGGELDLHSPIFTNQVLLARGSVTASTELSPSMSAMVDFQAGTPGHWEYRCQVQEHFTGGMRGMMVVAGHTQ